MIHAISRSLLLHRHQLSHEQIDALLGEHFSVGELGYKALALKKLKGFLEVTDALRMAGINFIPLKGFVLSQKIYGDPTVRQTGDADLLLSPDDIEKAIATLEKLDYVPSLFPWPLNPTRQLKLVRFRNQIALHNPVAELDVELHWQLFYYPILPPGKLNQIVAQNTTTLVLQGRTFRVLNPELDLLFLVIHGGMHGWRRLKWLVDVHEIARQKLFDERRLGEMVATFRAEKMTGLYNQLVKNWFIPCFTLPTVATTNSFLLKTAQQKITGNMEGEYHSPGSLLRYFWFIFTAFPGTAWRRRMLWYAWRSLWSQGANPIELLLPGRFLLKRYGVK